MTESDHSKKSLRELVIGKRILPETPGVYFFKDTKGNVLYVGKAVNLRRRVASYFSHAHDARIERLIAHATQLDYEVATTALEALVRESYFIKKIRPPFNIKDKDDKSFLYVVITADKFPRVVLVRGKDRARYPKGRFFGPFTSAASIRQGLRILRKIFPWNVHEADAIGHAARPCFDHHLGLCPGTCIGAISAIEYRTRIVRSLVQFLNGQRRDLERRLQKEMTRASASLDFESAEKFKRMLFAMNHIHDTALVTKEWEGLSLRGELSPPHRIEGYDISNINGDAAVGAMVVFDNGKKISSEYRSFKIRTVQGSNDVAMMEEVVARRLRHREWRYPDLIVVDGGHPQVGAARRAVLGAKEKIPVIGIAKGPARKKADIVGRLPFPIAHSILVQMRDEAHRCAIQYHKKVRRSQFLPKRSR